MERLITRIAMPLADCVKEGDDDDYEDSSAFENEGDESGLERDDEDKRTPSGEEEEDDSAPTPPPPKLIRRADQQVTTSPWACAATAAVKLLRITCITQYSFLERFKHYHASTGYVLLTTIQGHKKSSIPFLVSTKELW